MSIPAAVAELNKEIAALEKIVTESERTKARLISVRDSLLNENGGGAALGRRGRRGRKPAALKKSSVIRKATVAKNAGAKNNEARRRKRVLSPEARKKIGEAQRKRWAARKTAKKAV